MSLHNSLDHLWAGRDAHRVFGEPHQQPDGTTLIPVARVTAGRRFKATPIGVFVIKDGRAQWVPAVDANRIALFGELIGLVAAAIAAFALLRRPPWPDLARRVK